MVAPGEHGPAPGPDPAAVAVTAAAQGVPMRPAGLRDHLPGLEPERHVTDWGRSELVEEALDRTLFSFLYHYWFRVEVDGVQNVPADGPALLVANGAASLPGDAVMIAKTIRQAHTRPRALHFATERSLSKIPALDMLLVKAGAVSAHPANLHRLLFDEGQLVLVFPEASSARGLHARYRVRPFDRSQLVGAALRARAPIVPVAVLGAEEALPVVGRLPAGPLRGLTRWRLGALLPLPAKMRIRFLEPVEAAAPNDVDQDPVPSLCAALRALIQENLLEMLAQRRSVWLG